MKGNSRKHQQKREEGRLEKEESHWVKFQTIYTLPLFKFKFKHFEFNEEKRLMEIMWNNLGVFVGELEKQGAVSYVWWVDSWDILIV